MSTRMTEELHDALDQIFAVWPRLDLAFSLPSGSWLRPDAIDGKHKRLGSLDRAGVAALRRELWARALTGGQGVHWRPASADFALLDDLAGPVALGILGKYRSIGIETSANSHQAVIATARALTRLEQHQLQAALVQRLHAAGRHADAGATGAGQYARLPGFPHPGHGGRTVRLLGSSGALLLDPDAVLGSGCGTPKPACGPLQAGIRVPRPGVPARPQGVRGKAAVDGPAATAGGSEIDYRWTCAQIRAGVDPQSIISAITAAALARGKQRNESGCREYAERTVRNAASRVAAE